MIIENWEKFDKMQTSEQKKVLQILNANMADIHVEPGASEVEL